MKRMQNLLFEASRGHQALYGLSRQLGRRTGLPRIDMRPEKISPDVARPASLMPSDGAPFDGHVTAASGSTGSRRTPRGAGRTFEGVTRGSLDL
jgi:hypothetical protein